MFNIPTRYIYTVMKIQIAVHKESLLFTLPILNKPNLRLPSEYLKVRGIVYVVNDSHISYTIDNY